MDDKIDCTLVVLPSVPLAIDGDQYFMDIKAVEGLRLMAGLWRGPVKCLMRTGARSTIGYGRHYVAEELPFSVQIIDQKLTPESEILDGNVIFLASGDNYNDFDLVYLTQNPVVFIIEYTLSTRLAIIKLELGCSFRALKSKLWTLLSERKRLAAFASSAGLQANGRPAFNAYKNYVRAPMMFFDNRIIESQQATSDDLSLKAIRLTSGAPLRLAFSGRLERMKGANHLISIITSLRRRGLQFTFDIFGAGSLREPLEAQVSSEGVLDCVTFHGPVSFDDALIPHLKSNVDLFVCCHPQSDPSCTYIETLACGVPIVGFLNAAFQGILELGDVGQGVAIGDVEALADCVFSINQNRSRLISMSKAALDVAKEHSFEITISNRIRHIEEIIYRSNDVCEL